MSALRRKRFPLLMVGTAVVSVMASVLYFFGPVDAAKDDPHVGEPEHVKPASPAVQFASGVMPGGTRWTAATYMTKGGYACVDVTVAPAGRSAGGCFHPKAGPVQYGGVGVPGEAGEIAFGQIANAAPGRMVRLAGRSGRVVRVPVTSQGLFAAHLDEPLAEEPPALEG
jgi:hypothetical protein